MVNTIIKSDNLYNLFQFNQKLSIAILLILISISFFISEKYHYEFSNTLCLFLILTIGISHGALDHLKGKQLLKKLKKNNILYFYTSYILLALLIILFWIILPSFTILLFLIIASYHFGKEDSFIEDHRKITNKIQISTKKSSASTLLLNISPFKKFENKVKNSLNKKIERIYSNSPVWEDKPRCN